MIETIMSNWELRLTVLAIGVVAWGAVIGFGSAWLDNRIMRRRERELEEEFGS